MGILKSFGVLLVELSRRYDVPASLLTSSQSLCSCLHMALGTLSNALSVKFGHRRIVFCGGILAGIGLVSTAFVSSIEVFFVTYGLITGLGLGLCMSPALVIFGLFFKKYLALANGLAVSGSGFGAFVFPYLMLYLLEEYSIEGCMLILGGITLNICTCAALFRPFSFWSKPHVLKNEVKSEQREKHGFLNSKLEKERIILTNENNNHLPAEFPIDKSDLSSSVPCVREELHPMRDRSFTYANHGAPDVRYLRDRKENLYTVPTPMLFASIESIPTIFGNTKDSTKKIVYDVEDGFKAESAKGTGNAAVNWKLLKDPVFHMLNWGIFCAIYAHHTLFNVLPSVAEELGFSDSQGTMAVSVVGICDLIGRISTGVISSIISWKKISVYRLNLTIFAMGIMLLTFVSNFVAFMIICGCLGLFTGGYVGIQIATIIETLGKDNLSSAWGYVAFFTSISLFINPVIAGLLKDSTGTWLTSLQLASAICLLGVAIFSVEYLVRLKNRIKLVLQEK